MTFIFNQTTKYTEGFKLIVCPLEDENATVTDMQSFIEAVHQLTKINDLKIKIIESAKFFNENEESIMNLVKIILKVPGGHKAGDINQATFDLRTEIIEAVDDSLLELSRVLETKNRIFSYISGFITEYESSRKSTFFKWILSLNQSKEDLIFKRAKYDYLKAFKLSLKCTENQIRKVYCRSRSYSFITSDRECEILNSNYRC